MNLPDQCPRHGKFLSGRSRIRDRGPRHPVQLDNHSETVVLRQAPPSRIAHHRPSTFLPYADRHAPRTSGKPCQSLDSTAAQRTNAFKSRKDRNPTWPAHGRVPRTCHALGRPAVSSGHPRAIPAPDQDHHPRRSDRGPATEFLGWGCRSTFGQRRLLMFGRACLGSPAVSTRSDDGRRPLPSTGEWW